MSKKLPKKDYQSLFEHKRILASPYYVFYIKDFEDMVYKATVKKRIGNAVTRNWYKRRLRAVLASLSFDKSYLLLGVVLKRHNFSFESEKLHVNKVLQPIVG